MSNFSKPPLENLQENLDKGYVGLHIEQGVPILDRDINLLSDLITATVRNIITNYIGNGIATDSKSFAIQELIPPRNDFRILAGAIKPGKCLVGGIEVMIDEDCTYKNQPNADLLKDDPLTIPDKPEDLSKGTRDDIVYLDVWMVTIAGNDDHDLLNSADIGIQTSLRQKPTWVVRVAEGKQIPDPLKGHLHYPLAKISRMATVKEIHGGMITADLRQTKLNLANIERRLNTAEKQLRELMKPLPAPSFNPPTLQFSRMLGRAGKSVTLSGENFNVGQVQVLFGMVNASLGAISAKTIEAIVPKMPAGKVNIKVINDGGTAISDDLFEVIPDTPIFNPPSDQVHPKKGVSGRIITLKGINFDLATSVIARVSLPDSVLLDAQLISKGETLIELKIPGNLSIGSKVTFRIKTDTSASAFSVDEYVIEQNENIFPN